MNESGATDEGADPGAEGERDDGDGPQGAARMRARKSPQAFRTISEVADELQIPQHVLRFWETKFPQVRPLKRGGGRRYYRPDDIALLRRISGLLYVQGYTIKGVQRLLREGGGRLSDDIPPPPADEIAGADAAEGRAADAQLPMPGLLPPAAVPPPPGGAGVLARPRPRPEAAARGDAHRAEAEAARLRGALEDVLHTLEALRALLP